MLTELRVTNFALIEQLHLNIPSGFVALSGETGAGKSLLVDALALLLGQRATADHIRAGADEAELEAAFALPSDSPLLTRLRDADFLRDGQNELIVRRVLSRAGRGRAYVNGRLVAMQELEQLAGSLVDIHGQHEQQSLLASAAQMEALDQFGGLGTLIAAYGQAYAAWLDARLLLEEASAQARFLQEREDLLRYQAREISDANVHTGEDQALQDRCRRLNHAERLRGLAEQTYEALYGGEGALIERLGLIVRRVRDLSTIDRAAESWCEQLNEAMVVLQEVTAGVRRYREGLEDDPSQLAALETRLAQLEGLKKKYGGSLEAVRAKGAELDAQVAQLEQSQDRLDVLAADVEDRFQKARKLAAELTARRRRATSAFEEALHKELRVLHLSQAKVAVRIEPYGEPGTLGPNGSDRVQFLFSANTGEPLQPLARVASGGECSRVMLALKTVLAAHDTVPVLVFDEIDAGIGGAVATAIGTRLRNLARYHQVLCVTHAPQVASQAQAQIHVEKSAQDHRTVTVARHLEPSARQEVIARMLGGRTVTTTMLRAAAELLKGAGKS